MLRAHRATLIAIGVERVANPRVQGGAGPISTGIGGAASQGLVGGGTSAAQKLSRGLSPKASAISTHAVRMRAISGNEGKYHRGP